MLARDALGQFKHYAAVRGRRLDSVTGADVVDLMTGFYRDVRADDCDLESLGDMLFCEWGSYDWGAGEHFEFTVFRQFFCPPSSEAADRDLSEDADNHIWHLDLKLRFPPSPWLKVLGQGSQGCSSLADLDEFERAVRASPAFGVVKGRSDGEVAVLYECAG